MQHIIIQHTPKCAGTSLRMALQDAFGADQIKLDYDGDIGFGGSSLLSIDPVRYWREAKQIRLTARVVMGHIPIKKYAHIPNALRVALIRHPVQRAVSLYCFLTRTMKTQPKPKQIRDYVLDNDLDVAAFVQLPWVQEFYRRYYFHDVGPEDFDLIIDSEDFETGVSRMSAIVGTEIKPRREGALALINPEAHARETAILEDRETMREIRQHLRHDVRLFDEICTWPAAIQARS